MTVHLFGVRHHGPGCARALVAALDALAPDCLLIEGPPDAADMLAFVRSAEMAPPVALLVYRPDQPRQAAFYPFANFSPEWQALRFAAERNIPTTFIDLPLAVRFALDAVADETADVETAEATAAESEPSLLRDDPIGALAQAAGYADHELWWEHQIEQRRDATDLFAGIAEAMVALRADSPPPNGIEALREAHMRRAIHLAERTGLARIAVVCGAWHIPALGDRGSATTDNAMLATLKKVKTEATWIPWTMARLTSRSGYGAGVRSPGWYDHLWTAPDAAAVRWVARAAALLRDEDLDAAPANVVEAVLLADTLAALRNLPMPGLAELNDAIQAALCSGNEAPLRLIRERLEVGDRLGSVPENTPTVPLARDLAAQQRRLRITPTAEIREIDLDLRRENDRARSQLLHRLSLLGIPWGTRGVVRGKAGTFHELWSLRWQPELEVRVIEANVWGNTLADATNAALIARADAQVALPELTALLDGAILAALPAAISHLLERVRENAALAADLPTLVAALPPLARVARYGDVRETPRESVLPVIDGLFARVLIGLPSACRQLDDAAALSMITTFGQIEETLALLDDVGKLADWQATLRSLLLRDDVHGRIRGRACRLLLDATALSGDELERLARLSLSRVTPAAEAAAWIEGVVSGPGILLLHEDSLWLTLDTWLRGLDHDTFLAMLPLLRRAFSGFHSPERRQMGERVKDLRAGVRRRDAGGTATSDIDQERADLVLPVLALILGVRRGD